MEYKEYNEKDLQSFEYETTIQSDGNIIGTCELGKATIQMINDSNNYSVFKDSWIKTIHGSFYIHDVSPVQEKVNIKLECYDIKYKLDTKYDKTKHIFPLSLKDWRNSIFEDCGISYDNSDFPNSSLILNEQPYLEEGCSNRDVIKMIAEAGCSTVISDNEDVIYFEWFDDITEPYEVIDWLELTTEIEMSNPINTVVLGRGDTEDNVYYPNPKPNIPNEFRIDNNYILDPQEVGSDEDRRYDVIQNIYDRVNNFSYLIFNMRSQSITNKLSIKLGQKIKYKDIWNNELIAYVMTKKIIWLGGNLEKDDNYEITLSAEELKESSTNFSYSSNIKNDILKVERKADKNNRKIEDIIEQNSKFATKITNVEQTIDTILQTVSNIENLEREVSNKNYIYIENAMMGQLEYLEINGPFSLLYPSDDLYPSDNLYPLDSYLIIDKTKELSNDAIRIHLPYFNLKDNEKFIINNGESFINKEDGTTEKLSKYRDIEENEDLSGKTLYYDFPSSFEDELGQYHRDKGEYYLGFISTNKDKKIYTSYYWSQFAYPSVVVGFDYIFSGDGTGATNQGTIKLSDDFGKIISIDLKNPTFKYLKIMEDMDKIDLPLFEGNNYIYLESFQDDNIQLNAKYIIKNGYTDKFATKVEMNNSITQSNERTDIELSKKVGNDEIIAKINMSTEKSEDGSYIGIQADKLDFKGKEFNLTGEEITIKSKNFNVDTDGNIHCSNAEISGNISSMDGNIGGWTINENGLSNGTVFIHNDGSSTIYTVADLIIIREYIMNNSSFNLSEAMIKHYDINGDGQVTSSDYVILQNLIGIKMS